MTRLDLRWDSRAGPFDAGCWRVRPLTSGHELVEEGRRMKHCVERYIRACHDGCYRLFTVERRQTETPFATIGLKHEKGAWRLDQVRGPGNTEVVEELAALGEAALRRYRSA